MMKRPSEMTQAEFVEVFGAIYEHSPWMAEQLFSQGLSAEHDDCKKLTRYFQQLFLDQTETKQLEVINAHPDLAGKLALNKQLTKHSNQEQSRAGLDQCSAEEFEKFNTFNQEYKAKFRFPFIKAVKGLSRQAILDEFEARLTNSHKSEFKTALIEINKIAAFRLQDWFTSQQTINLASAQAGAEVLYATDDFFAAKERLIQDHDPIFLEGKYDSHGKWMDGWESRRKRETGHDFCVVKLAQTGIISSITIDTAFFTGNYPPCASLDGYSGKNNPLPDDSNWQPVLPTVSLNGDQEHEFSIQSDKSFSHVRLNIFPDGGIARLKIFGHPDEQQ